jgi:hypothetical protein
MSPMTTPTWHKAALDTLIWLLDPEPDEAGKALLRLFNDIVAFYERKYGSRSRELAAETLSMVAEDVYLNLTGLRREDVDRGDVVHEVPRSISHEVYAAERERLPRLALSYAKSTQYEQASEASSELEVGFVIRDTLEKEAPENEARRPPKESIKDERKPRKGLEEHSHVEKMVRETSAKVHFTAYYLRSAEILNWSTVLAYMHIAKALPFVYSDSRRRLGEAAERTSRKTASKRVEIARGARILVVPQSDWLEFNPPQVTFAWLEDFHCGEFRCRIRSDVKADSKFQDVAVRIAFYVEPVLVAEISFTVSVSHEPEQKHQTASITARPYQRVFVSYSREDSSIADQLGEAYKALGMEYLRDVNVLRSGEKWAPALLDLIDKSEIFQLLWSEAAKRSPYVRQEWQHALGLNRSSFIRPAYWKRPMPAPPRELADIHFAYLELKDRGT